jgi:hypothetical protein
MLPLGGGRGGWQPAEEDIEDLGLEELGEWFWYKKKQSGAPCGQTVGFLCSSPCRQKHRATCTSDRLRAHRSSLVTINAYSCDLIEPRQQVQVHHVFYLGNFSQIQLQF